MKSAIRRKRLPGAVAWGGLVSGALYIGATLTLLVAIGKNDINVLQGIVQAVSHMAAQSWGGVDHYAVCADAELINRWDWIGLDGRFGAHSICRRPRFLYAIVAREGSPEVCNPLRRA